MVIEADCSCHSVQGAAKTGQVIVLYFILRRIAQERINTESSKAFPCHCTVGVLVIDDSFILIGGVFAKTSLGRR